MRMILILAIAGALGTISRYGLSGFVQRINGTGFPYGTMVVNLTGCFLIGLLMTIALNTDYISPTIRTAITIGFLGAFTTFSTFGYETFSYIASGSWLTAGLNVLLNVIPGIIAVFLGIIIARALVGGA